MGDPEQLVSIVQLDVRDTGLQELDVRALCRLELLRCDRNCLSLLRVSGHALKSLHVAHNGSNPASVLGGMKCVMSDGTPVTCVVFAELKLLDMQPLPENLTDVDLSW